MIDLTKPVDASFELNNKCNLMCPQCSRNIIKDGELQKNPDTTGNPLSTLDSYEMSLDDFKAEFQKTVSTLNFNLEISRFNFSNVYL